MTAPVEILIHVTGLAAARVCAKHALKPRGMSRQGRSARALSGRMPPACADGPAPRRSEEHTSELQSLMRISYAVFCLKKKKNNTKSSHTYIPTTQTLNKTSLYKHK